MDTIEVCGQKNIAKKREGNISKLNLEEFEVLKISENAEGAAKEFDRILSKLLILIKYSIDNDNIKKTELEQHTNNLIKKLLNPSKYEKFKKKTYKEQKYFLEYIYNSINSFLNDSYLSEVYNSIPKTSLLEFSKKSIGNQIFQILYDKNWGNEKICEGGSCSYWAVLWYNFFNKLKEAGLDIKISFFRYKKIDDDNVSFHTNRHSGLIINFQGEDYMIDRYRLLNDNAKSIANKLQSYIDKFIQDNKPKDAQLFENFRYENRKETDSVIFFDDPDSFIKYCENHPESYKVSFKLNKPVEEYVKRIEFEFGDVSFCLGEFEYYLTDNDLSTNNLIENIINKISIKRIGAMYMPVTDYNKEKIKKSFDLIKNMIDMDKLYESFTSGDNLKTEIIKDNDGNLGVMII